MVLIGMLHHRADPEKVSKTYAYSAVAKAEGVDFFYFTPGKVNIEEQNILGRTYEKGEWVEKEFPFPDAIYNASSPLNQKMKKIVDYLFERIPFTSHPIGDKLQVYKRIAMGKEFQQYLIPTHELSGIHQAFEMINRNEKMLIKPVSGHQGGGIVLIEKNGKEDFRINERGNISTVNEEQLMMLISQKMKEQNYIIQPFIKSQTSSGLVYDFRLHVQKNGEGKWVITSIYPRIGRFGSITSNLGSGGYTAFLDAFLEAEYEESAFEIQRQLEYFALSFANHFESLYDGREFDELGIDVGMDSRLRFWLFEVNWRPGPPMIFNVEMDVARNTIQYARYLAEKHRRNKR